MADGEAGGSGDPGVGAERARGALTRYQIYRDYILHEDELIHHRSTWNVTVQSFLFAAFALVVQSRIEGPGDDFGRYLSFIVAASGIPFAGMLVAGVSFMSLKAAVQAIRHVKAEYDFGPDRPGQSSAGGDGFRGRVRRWMGLESVEEWRRAEQVRRTVVPLLPSLTGGGHRGAVVRGFLFPYTLSASFFLVWLLVALALHGGLRDAWLAAGEADCAACCCEEEEVYEDEGPAESRWDGSPGRGVGANAPVESGL